MTHVKVSHLTNVFINAQSEMSFVTRKGTSKSFAGHPFPHIVKIEEAKDKFSNLRFGKYFYSFHLEQQNYRITSKWYFRDS